MEKELAFSSEATGYEKTILSDLQGAWLCLRDSITEHAEFTEQERMLFHLDEAMSWETVRHLERMKPLLIMIRNLALQGKVSDDVMDEIEDISDILAADRWHDETRK
jgi:hypothetical protein